MAPIDRPDLAGVGARLRQRRKDQHLSQQGLAALMQVPQSWISDVEKGKRQHVEAETVYRFARALDCTMDYLMGLTDDPAPPTKRPRPRNAPVG